MPKTLIQMTELELRKLVGDAVEEKLIELLGDDPDLGLELQPTLRERLEKQRQDVAEGRRGKTLDAVARDLDLI